MEAEGWYIDPYGAHEARWFSAGTPTALVRDGHQESQDPPPDTPYEGALVRVDDHEPEGGADLKRVDDGGHGGSMDPRTQGGRASDTISGYTPMG